MTCHTIARVRHGPAESKTPCMQRNSMRENRETQPLPERPIRVVGRKGNPKGQALYERWLGVERLHSTCEVPEQDQATWGRRAWREGGWPRRSDGRGRIWMQSQSTPVHYTANGTRRSSWVGDVIIQGGNRVR